jgi:hypothetical protein
MLAAASSSALAHGGVQAGQRPLPVSPRHLQRFRDDAVVAGGQRTEGIVAAGPDALDDGRHGPAQLHGCAAVSTPADHSLHLVHRQAAERPDDGEGCGR